VSPAVQRTNGGPSPAVAKQAANGGGKDDSDEDWWTE
jgi:hypothetical protein